MSLATRCPACGTTFRVVQDQLKISEGWVRCGHCQEIFNALESLYELPTARSEPAPPPPPAALPPRDLTDVDLGDPAPDGAVDAPVTPVAADPPALAANAGWAGTGVAAAEAEAAPLTGATAWATVPSPSPSPEPEPEPEPEHERAVQTREPVEPEPAPPPAPEAADLGDAPDSLAALLSRQAAGWAAHDATGPTPFSAAVDAPAQAPEAAPRHPPDAGPAAAAVDGPAEAAMEGSAHAPVDSTRPSSAGAPVDDPVDDLLDDAADGPAAEPADASAELATPEPADPAAPPPVAEAGEEASPEPRLAAPPEPAAWQPDTGWPGLGKRRRNRALINAAATDADSAAASAASAGPADAAASNDDVATPGFGRPRGRRRKPEFMRQVERAAQWQRPAVRAVLGSTAAVLGLLLLGQMAWHWRDEASARWPALGRSLASACQHLGCTLQAPRRLERLVLDSSQLSRTAWPGTLRLMVDLRNTAEHAVRTPALDLRFTDANGQTLVRRVLRPDELGGTAPAAIEAQGLWHIDTGLNFGTLKVTGFSAEIFYP